MSSPCIQLFNEFYYPVFPATFAKEVVFFFTVCSIPFSRIKQPLCEFTSQSTVAFLWSRCLLSAPYRLGYYGSETELL